MSVFIMARNSRSEADDGNAVYGMMMSMGGMILLSRFYTYIPARVPHAI